MRALGTVLLGATSQQLDSAAVHLHEHVAAVGVVRASGGLRLGADRWPAVATNRAELVTEVAGVCCRLLSEHPLDDHSCAAWELPSGSFVSVEGDARGITVCAQDSAGDVALDAGTAAVLRHVGWPEDSIEGPTLAATVDWNTDDDAIVVAEIAGLVVGTLVDVLGADDVRSLTRDLDLVPADTL